MSSGRTLPVRILLVEDSPGDVNLTREALQHARVATELNVVGNGEEALRHLRWEREHASANPTDLVLLDLNLPKMGGHEVLKEMKNDKDLQHIPVIVLTTSADNGDILCSYQLHANAFVTKPVAFKDFLNAFVCLEEFWLQLVRLPTD